MFTRTFVPAVLGAILLSTSALAATTTTTTGTAAAPATMQTQPEKYSTIQKTTEPVASATDRCSKLQVQFDHAIRPYIHNYKYQKAQVWRTVGGDLCQGRDHAMGLAMVERALREIGVEPHA